MTTDADSDRSMDDELDRVRNELAAAEIRAAAIDGKAQAFAGEVARKAAEIDDDAELGRRVRDLVIEYYGPDSSRQRRLDS